VKGKRNMHKYENKKCLDKYSANTLRAKKTKITKLYMIYKY